MFGFLKKSSAGEPVSPQQQDHLAELSRGKITQLEQQLAINPRDGVTQKELMLEYNRALSLFAKSPRYRNSSILTNSASISLRRSEEVV